MRWESEVGEWSGRVRWNGKVRSVGEVGGEWREKGDVGWKGEGCGCTCLEAASLSIKESAFTK